MAVSNKKGFVFSLFALFLSFLLFSFSFLFLFDEPYSEENLFKESRIISLNDELNYFRNVYVKNMVSFSFYNSINSIVNDSEFNYQLNKNITRLNELVKEAMINGSISGVPQDNLENKTIGYFYDVYEETFNDSYLAQMDFEIIDINVFEQNSYFISLQADVSYNLTSIEDISSWSFNESIVVEVSIVGQYDPEFILENNIRKRISPVELFRSNSNWSLEILNETLNNSYDSVYFEPLHKYSLGTSFINRLLNNSHSSYLNVTGFWSFDYDLDEGGVYDTSLNFEDGIYYGNTRLGISFNNGTFNSTHVEDESPYENLGSFVGSPDCIQSGVFGFGCSFDGIDDEIIFNNDDSFTFDDDFTISIWIKTSDSSSNVNLIKKGESGSHFHLSLDSGLLNFEIEDNLGNGPLILTSEDELNDSNFHHIAVVVNKSNVVKIYIDGILDSTLNISSITGAITNSQDLVIGGQLSNFYLGVIDEVNIFSKALIDKEVTTLFEDKQITNIDYIDSLYGSAIYFDGVDDILNLTNSSFNLQGNSAVEIWFKNSKTSSEHVPFGSIVDNRDPTNSKGFSIEAGSLRNKSQLAIGGVSTFDFDILEDDWNHIVVSKDSSNNIEIYVNSILVRSENSIINPTDSRFSMGLNRVDETSFFNGFIDEVKFYNRTLLASEVKTNYLNYESSAKGCCNYLSLINPTILGFDKSPQYDLNTSYSSKVFYDFYNRSNRQDKDYIYDITLFEPTNLSSNDVNEPYYNLKFDICLMQAYSVFDFDLNANIIFRRNNTEFCENLVSDGIY